MNINTEVLLERKKIYLDPQNYQSARLEWTQRTNRTGKKLRELGLSLWKKSAGGEEIFEALKFVQRSIGYYVPSSYGPSSNMVHWTRVSDWYGFEFTNTRTQPYPSDPTKYFFTWPNDFHGKHINESYDTVVLLSSVGVHWLNDLAESYLGIKTRKKEDVDTSGVLTLDGEQAQRIQTWDTQSAHLWNGFLPLDLMDKVAKQICLDGGFNITPLPELVKEMALFGNAYIKVDNK
jgi:hypothetical protein